MAKLPSDTQDALRDMEAPIRLPAMYDQLTWWQRRQVREEYVVRQGWLCWYCKRSLNGPPEPALVANRPLDPRYWGPEFLKHPIHLHHNHSTGLTIGATHAYCNAVLAQYHGE